MARPPKLELSARRARLFLLIPLIAGGALRFRRAAELSRVAYPDLAREESYYETGVTLLSCHLFAIAPSTDPTAHLPPAYPAFIAGVESLFARPFPGHVRWAQAALSAFEIAFAYLLAEAALSPLAGLLAASWLAFEPGQIAAVASLNVHLFYSFALLLLAAAVLRWLARGDRESALTLGFALAFSLLCRVAHYPFLVLFPAAALFAWKFPRARWASVATVLLAAALFLAPMSARNFVQFRRLSPFDGKGAYLLLSGSTGTHALATLEQSFDEAEALEPGFRARGLTGEALESELVRLAVARIRAHPLDWLGYCLGRFWIFWSGLWPYWSLGLIALLWERRARGLQALGLVAFSLSGYALAGGGPIYRLAAVPLLCALAGAGVAALLSGRSPLEPAAARPVAQTPGFRAAFAVALGLAIVVYAGLVSAAARETREYPRLGAGGPRVPALTCPDGRALALLKMAASADPGGGGAARTYLTALNRRVGETMELKARGEAVPPGAAADPAEFDWYVGRYPGDADGRRGRGVLRFSLGDSDGARADFARALALKPDDLESALSLASLLTPEKKAEARRVLKSALAAAARSRRGGPDYEQALAMERELGGRTR